MPLIWCSISGHGFGHAAQVVPVLNELGRQIPNLKLMLRTTVPSWFFQDRVRVPWELSVHEQDIGCVQHGPLHIDLDQTWASYRRFHSNWEDRVTAEADAIARRSPDLVLSDISHLAIEAGVRAKIPTIGLSSICWDQVLDGLRDGMPTDYAPLIHQIRHSYRLADLMIRVTPSIAMPAFRQTVDVGPIAAPVYQDRRGLRDAVGVSKDERLVAIAFGGIPLTAVPWDQIDAMTGYRFIVPGTVPPHSHRAVSSETLPFPFQTIMASCDLLLTKPGYGTIVEAVASATPVLYVRRYNFPDEHSLITYLHRYGRGAELSAEDFANGRWRRTLEAVLALPAPHVSAPPPTGAAEAADILKKYVE